MKRNEWLYAGCICLICSMCIVGLVMWSWSNCQHIFEVKPVKAGYELHCVKCKMIEVIKTNELSEKIKGYPGSYYGGEYAGKKMSDM